VNLHHTPGHDRDLCRHTKKKRSKAHLRVCLRAASQAFGLPNPSPSVRLRRLLQQSPDFGCRKTYNITKNCKSKLYQNMAACGSTRCRCCTWPVEQPNRLRRKTTTTPPLADTMATFNDDTFLSPHVPPQFCIVTEWLEVVRCQRSQQRSPPCSVVINVRLYRSMPPRT